MRSYLFAPATNAQVVPKALTSAADVVVLDLEDAVAHGAKDQAHDVISSNAELIGQRPTHVRVARDDFGYARSDLEVAVSSGAIGIRLPKADDPEEIVAVGAWLDNNSPSTILHITIENALGLTRIAEMAHASKRVERAVFGERDFVADLGVDGPGPLTDHARALLALTSRAAGLGSPIDGAYIDLEDQEGLRRSAIRARDLGFWGKSAIHPSQLSVIHEVFQHGPEQLAWAEKVQAAYDDALRNGSAVSVVDGIFVDAAVVRRARMILDGDQE